MRHNKLYRAIVAINSDPLVVHKTASVGWSSWWPYPLAQTGEWPPGQYTLRNEVEVRRAGPGYLDFSV